MHPHEVMNLRPTTDFSEKFAKEGYTLLPKEARAALREDLDPNDWYVWLDDYVWGIKLWLCFDWLTPPKPAQIQLDVHATKRLKRTRGLIVPRHVRLSAT